MQTKRLHQPEDLIISHISCLGVWLTLLPVLNQGNCTGMHRVMSILLHAVTGKSSWEALSSGPKRKAIKPRPPGVRLDVAKKTPKKSSSSSSASSSCNRLETCSNHPTSPAEPQVAGSTRLKSGRYRHHDLHRQRDVHLSLQSKWPSATLPQASKEHIQDQSGPTLTKCDRSVLPLLVARQHCAVQAILASTKR